MLRMVDTWHPTPRTELGTILGLSYEDSHLVCPFCGFSMKAKLGSMEDLGRVDYWCRDLACGAVVSRFADGVQIAIADVDDYLGYFETEIRQEERCG